MIRRFYKITPLLLLFLLLAGCSSPNQPIDPVNGGSLPSILYIRYLGPLIGLLVCSVIPTVFQF